MGLEHVPLEEGRLNAIDEQVKWLEAKPPKDCNLEAYICSYEGHVRFERLFFLVEHFVDLVPPSCALMWKLVRQYNHSFILKKIKDYFLDFALSPSEVEWMKESELKAQKELVQLESNLTSAKIKGNKEAIWNAYYSLGDFYMMCGDLGKSLRMYLNSREYMVTPENTLNIFVATTRVSVLLHNFTYVPSNVARVHALTGVVYPASLSGELQCWSALAFFSEGKYKQAAIKFLEVKMDAELIARLPCVMTLHDIAAYTAVSMLAEWERYEIQKCMIGNTPFRVFLEAEPRWQVVLEAFLDSRYHVFMKTLEELICELAMDMYAYSHLPYLTETIRAKALLQYLRPYDCVDLNVMSEVFLSNVTQIERELARLIVTGRLYARIDSQGERLYSSEQNERNITFKKALESGTNFERNAYSILLRFNVMNHSLCAQPEILAKMGQIMNVPSDHH